MLLAAILPAGIAPAADRDTLLSQCPPVAFIRRSAHMGGTNGTMFSQVHSRGSELMVYNPAEPKTAAKTILQTVEGYIYDISPSYDGRKLLLTYREKAVDAFHIWEIRVDGSGLRQLTSGQWHDFNPVYYPDGRIVFASSRCESFSLCQDFLASALYICRADGSDIRRIDYTTLCTSAPAILPDGRIICTRWEYQDKNIFSWQGLWTLQPNGQKLQLYYGNTLTVPNSRWGAKPIPGTGKVILTMAAHHHQPIGDIAIVDPTTGTENLEGMRQITFATQYRVTKGRDWRDTNWGPGDKLYPWAFVDPWPVNAEMSLVSYGGGSEDGPKCFRIVLLGHDGRIETLYGDGNKSFVNPVSLAPRPLPHAIPGDVPTVPGAGTFYVADVYQGLLEQGVKRGQVKHLRIWQQIPKKYNTEGPRYHDHYPVIGYGTYYVKSILGTVPVPDDGGIYFTAPSGVELYFQAIDADGKEVVRMGSVTQITTGEQASCAGCHDSRQKAAPATTPFNHRLQTRPADIAPPVWGAGPVDYVKLVQPVLDRYCISCHDGPTPDAGINLSGDKTRFFSMSYEALCRRKFVDGYFINPGPTGNFPALASGSWTSKITKLMESKHGGVDVDPESRKRIYAWIDSNLCYYSTWDMDRPYTQGGRDPCFRVKNDDGVYPKAVKFGHGGKNLEPMPWFARFEQITAELGMKEPDTTQCINFTHPQWSPILVNNLARSAGGLADDKRALFKSKDDTAYKSLLQSLTDAARSLLDKPRMDMPGAKPLPQDRNFGRIM